MCGHAIDASLHDLARFHAEHGKALLDHVAVAASCKFLVLEFLLESFELHAADAFGTHECICHDDTRQLIDREKTLLDIRCRLYFIAAETPAVGDDGLDVFFVHSFRFQKFADVMAVLVREGFVVDVVQIADGFPVIFVTMAALTAAAWVKRWSSVVCFFRISLAFARVSVDIVGSPF